MRTRPSKSLSGRWTAFLITTGAYLSTDAINAAIDHNVEILFMDEFGEPYGRLWHSKLGSTTLIRRRQLEYAQDARGLALAQVWIAEKFSRQIDFLKKTGSCPNF